MPTVTAPSMQQELLASIESSRAFFDRTTRVLDESDADFRVTPDNATVAATFAHVAGTIDWFRVALVEDRWDMDFAGAAARESAVTTLAEGRALVAAAWERFRDAVSATSEERLLEIFPENPILPGRPRFHVMEGIVDHTAHHRGALAVVARLRGKVPPVPYMD